MPRLGYEVAADGCHDGDHSELSSGGYHPLDVPQADPRLGVMDVAPIECQQAGAVGRKLDTPRNGPLSQRSAQQLSASGRFPKVQGRFADEGLSILSIIVHPL